MLPTLYGFDIVLEEFGQNISHVTSKTYFTHTFFTDRQVYGAITGIVENIGEWQPRRTLCTAAFPLGFAERKRVWFSTIPRDYYKENALNKKSYYLMEGYQEYLVPATRFRAFSFIKPPAVIFIGKKRAMACIENVKKCHAAIKKDDWTTRDLVYTDTYRAAWGSGIKQANIEDASSRFLVGRFFCDEVLEVTYNDETYRFYQLLAEIRKEENIGESFIQPTLIGKPYTQLSLF